MANADSRQIVTRITRLFEAGYDTDTLTAELDKLRPLPAGHAAAKARTTAFTRGGYSFRPGCYTNGARFFTVHAKGDRSSFSDKARLVECSDGQTWYVGVGGSAYDARPSFSEACDLVIARLPREGA